MKRQTFGSGSALSIVRLYHDLLGTYGDAGNTEVLVHRLNRRGLAAELIEVEPGDAVPTSGAIYLLGGGEDGPQTAALALLRADGGLGRAIDSGATLLAVCAGFQLIGTSLPGVDGEQIAGLDFVDAHTEYTADPRSVGEVFAWHGEVLLTGFENHQGLTTLGAEMSPLAQVVYGVGNLYEGDRVDGVKHGRVYGTYLHGPVLARNPELADELLTSQLGDLPELPDDLAQSFAQERRGQLPHFLRNPEHPNRRQK